MRNWALREEETAFSGKKRIFSSSTLEELD
jgi:hypothetical protein